MQFDADNVFIAVLPEHEEPPVTCMHEMEWRKGQVQSGYDIVKEHPPEHSDITHTSMAQLPGKSEGDYWAL